MKNAFVLFFLGISLANAADFKEIRCSQPADHSGDPYSYYTVVPLENDEYEIKGFINPGKTGDNQEHQVLRFKANYCRFKEAIFHCAYRLDKETGASWQIMMDNEMVSREKMFSSGKTYVLRSFDTTILQSVNDHSIDWALIQDLGLKKLPTHGQICSVKK
jgi:hypothetical protein